MGSDAVRTIGVCGAGIMGAGIIQQAAAAGYRVLVFGRTATTWERGLNSINRSLDYLVGKQKMAPEGRDALLARISYSTDPASLADADYVVEAVAEEFEVKRELFRVIDEVCRGTVVFASNSSSLSMTELAAVSGRPESFVGMHFFNPVPAMKLVEIIPALQTSAETIATATALARDLNKTPVLCKDTPGFIVNRLLAPMLLDAVRLWESGAAGAEDIDAAMKLGMNLQLGPLEMVDLIGADIVYHIAETLYEYTREPRFAPPPALRRMVKAGRLGRKSGSGFYDYSQ